MEKLGVNIQLLITQLVNFLITMGILTYLLYKPILKMLAERKKKIEEGLQLTEEAKKEKERLSEIKKQILKEAKEEGQRIVKQSVVEAKTKSEEVVKEEIKNIQAQKEKIFKEIEQERQNMMEKMKKQAIDLAVVISEKILGEKMTKNDQQKLVSEAIKRIKTA